jgi:hypothetical protein
VNIESTLAIAFGVAIVLLLSVWIVMARAPAKPQVEVAPQRNRPNEELVYECPRCGQGGLAVADILVTPRAEAVVCSECDCIWLSPKLVGINNADGSIESVLPRIGAPPDWSTITYDFDGIPWTRVAPDYQQILSMRRSSSANNQNA